MHEYTADDIEIPAPLEGIRRRPQMYIGSTDSVGIQHVIAGLIQTCVGEFLAGHASSIRVTQTHEGWSEIADNGLGVRVDSPPEFGGRSFLEVALTEFWAEGFGLNRCHDPYLLPIAPACGEQFQIETHRDGRRYSLAFTHGALSQPFRDHGPSDSRGTTMRWKPDPVIFQSHTLDTTLLKQHLEILVAVHPGLRIDFQEQTSGEQRSFLFPGGCADLLRTKNTGRSVAYPVCSLQMDCQDVKFDVAFQHVAQGVGRIHSYVNAAMTENGSHVRGFLSGLASSIREIGTITGNVAAADVNSKSVMPGLTVELSIITENAHYESPTKSVLHNPEIGVIIAKQVFTRILALTRDHPSLGSALVQSVIGG